MDKVHKGKKPKFNKYNFEGKIFIRREECDAPGFKEKKKRSDFYGDTRDSTYPIISPPLISLKISHYLIPSWLASSSHFVLSLTFFFLFLFLSTQHKLSSLHSLSLSRGTYSTTLSLPSFFSARSLKNS